MALLPLLNRKTRLSEAFRVNVASLCWLSANSPPFSCGLSQSDVALVRDAETSELLHGELCVVWMKSLENLEKRPVAVMTKIKIYLHHHLQTVMLCIGAAPGSACVTISSFNSSIVVFPQCGTVGFSYKPTACLDEFGDVKVMLSASVILYGFSNSRVVPQ